MPDYSLLPVAHEATDLAADLIRTRYAGALTAKGDRDMASEVDFAVERALRELLAKRTPGIGVLGEEEGHTGTTAGEAELTWVLDPVDGTVNFIHGLPLCAVSLGLVRGGRPVLGVIDTPFLRRRYHAVHGGGAYADNVPIQVSGVSDLAETVVGLGDYAVGEGADAANRVRLALTVALVPRVQRLRMLGSAAIDLAWLAEGRLDAVVMLSNRPWDTAAGVVIAREAGAKVLDRHGGEHTLAAQETLAGAAALLVQVLPLVRGAVS